MKITSSLLFLAAGLALGSSSVNAESVILRTPLEVTGYCHFQYLPNSQGSLASGLVMDYYGSCEHDPLGPDEILSRSRARSRSTFDNDGDDGE